MRRYLLFLIIFPLALAAFAKNGKPQIISQKTLTTNQGQSITITLSDLEVRDDKGNIYPDYPNGFSLDVFSGDNYSVSGNTVTPDGGFTGTLTVPVRVSIGNKKSEKFNLKIQVVAKPSNPQNQPPVIIGQLPLSTKQDKSITVRLSDLLVTDPDNNYPSGFTLKVLAGSNYTVTGTTIQPNNGFSGVLTVPVVVNDGKNDSAPFNLQITVEKKVEANNPPVITGQNTVTTLKNKPITIMLKHLIVTDPDNAPGDLTLSILPGENYTISGNQVIPAPEFKGVLNVPVTVSDGKNTSQPFTLRVTVVDSASLEITGQKELSTSEDKPLQIGLSDLEVNDPGKTYPNGFQLKIASGEHYSVSGTTITPAANFYGNLSVPVTVSGAGKESNAYNVSVSVTPVNDPPVIEGLTETPLSYQLGQNPIPIGSNISISDPDDEAMSMAEVGFETGYYQANGDALVPTYTSPSVRAIFDPGAGTLFLIGEAPIAEYAQVLRSITYQFTPTDSIQPQRSKQIYFTVNDGTDVSERKFVMVQFEEDVTLDIPTVFTPNDDNANDTWRVKAKQGSENNSDLLVRVYSKTGVLVYESFSLEDEWDGTFGGHVLPADSYMYLIQLNQSVSKKEFKGYVTILH